MNQEKYTERMRGFLQSAQMLALREGHQRLVPDHLLKVLLDDPEGLAANLIASAGGDSRAVHRAVEANLAKQPKVEGQGAGQIYMAPETARIFDQAEAVAEKAGDSFVTVERMLLALALAKGTEAADALAKGNVKPQALEKAIQDLRKGRKADTASAESGYDALKKYARDLTQAARDGKLDPVIGRDEEIRRTIQILARRKDVRVLLAGTLPDPASAGMTIKSVAGGYLFQSRDSGQVRREDLKIVTQRAPSEQELKDLLFAFTVAKPGTKRLPRPPSFGSDGPLSEALEQLHRLHEFHESEVEKFSIASYL